MVQAVGTYSDIPTSLWKTCWFALSLFSNLTQGTCQFKQRFRYLLVCLGSENNRFVRDMATVRQVVRVYTSFQCSLQLV